MPILFFLWICMVAKFSSLLGMGSRGAALIRGLAALQEMIMCSDGRGLLLHGHTWAVLLGNLGEGRAPQLSPPRALLLLALSTYKFRCRVSIVQLCWATILRKTTCFSWKWMGVHSSELKLGHGAWGWSNGIGEKYSRKSVCEKLFHLQLCKATLNSLFKGLVKGHGLLQQSLSVT